MKLKKVIFSLFILALLSACVSPTAPEEIIDLESTPVIGFSDYDFPNEIKPENKYLFYLHGKIIEDQGIPAVSPDYGEYQYQEILKVFEGYGFTVISEQREKDIDSFVYVKKITGQITNLMEAHVPAENISVIGASKGGGIAILISHLIADKDINYVLLSICHPDVVQAVIEDGNNLHGRVLSIFDAADEFAGSCEELFLYSEGQSLADYDEIVLNIGSGHGMLYEPLDEWVLPSVQWANGEICY